MPSADRLLAWLQRIAPTLKEGEVRLLLYFIGESPDSRNTLMRRSFEALSQHTGLSPRRLEDAVDSLTERGFIEVHAGSGQTPNGYVLIGRKVRTKSRRGGSE
ncbi:MAG TPA: hypothetical protein VFQ79_24640 [Bryobacteraceae bacterium]|nr:hypothetical protein [Bryobacteraceae bacterium]